MFSKIKILKDLNLRSFFNPEVAELGEDIQFVERPYKERFQGASIPVLQSKQNLLLALQQEVSTSWVQIQRLENLLNQVCKQLDPIQIPVPGFSEISIQMKEDAEPVSFFVDPLTEAEFRDIEISMNDPGASPEVSPTR